MRALRPISLCVFLMLVMASSLLANAVFIDGGLFYELDTETGAVREVGFTPFPLGSESPVVVDQVNGIIYTTGQLNGQTALGSTIIKTGSSRILTPSGPIGRLAAAGGRLFTQVPGIAGENLFELDPDSGHLTPLGSISTDGGFNFAASESELFVNDIGGVRVFDLESGVETASIGVSVDSIAAGAETLVLGGFGTFSVMNRRTGVTSFPETPGFDPIEISAAVERGGETVVIFGFRGAFVGVPEAGILSISLVTDEQVFHPISDDLFLTTLAAYRPLPPAESIEEINSIVRTEDSIRLTIPLAFGRTIGVEYSQNLSPGSWIELGNFFQDGDEAVYIDPDTVRIRRETGYYRAFLRPLNP